MPPNPPIVTLITDFGLQDHYVAAMKARLLEHCPGVVLVDVTHAIPPQDVRAGSIMLERAISSFSAGAIHLAVVDPGVGTSRGLLVTQIHQQTVVCPDNGLITWAWRRLGPGITRELEWRPAAFSSTFHGRDILAPVAGMLAAGAEIDRVAGPAQAPLLLDISPAPINSNSARIIHIDAYGNATTNMLETGLTQRMNCRIRLPSGIDLGPIRKTYGDVAPGQPLALIGSSGLLEIAVRNGSAAKSLGLAVGDVIELA